MYEIVQTDVALAWNIIMFRAESMLEHNLSVDQRLSVHFPHAHIVHEKRLSCLNASGS